MDRRDTLKTMLLGGMAGTGLVIGCSPSEGVDSLPKIESNSKLYGRTPEEIERDNKLKLADSIFTQDEVATIAILCDIILPATSKAGSAKEAGVPDFIDFIVKDIPNHQLPMKGGLAWLHRESSLRFNKPFKDLSNTEQIAIVDDIAYPEDAKPAMRPGVVFFNRMRDLTLTGYYTSKMGIEELGYKGNIPNVWDGVPEDVLKDHDVDYDPEWVAKCVDQSKRNDVAKWDDKGNLIS